MVSTCEISGFKIQTECPYSMKNDNLIINSTSQKVNFAFRCDFELRTSIRPSTKSIAISFKILMTFDPDGSVLTVLLGDRILLKTEFVGLIDKKTRHGDWANLEFKSSIPENKGKEIKMDFSLFHGDEPFQAQIKDLILKEDE
ncbi:MAG: hypothetical protein ACXQS8_03660 [Candidatus Helarchaeales archaeon]